MDFLLRDFVETADGLIFALVAHGVEEGRVIGFLRYVRDDGRLQKLGTEAANHLLRERRPDYLYYSERRDAVIHGVPALHIVRHHRARQRLRDVLSDTGVDPVEGDVRQLCALFRREGLDLDHVGITGSVLVGAQKAGSDIDLVIYGHERFQQARRIIRKLQEKGDTAALDAALWRETYERRGCALGFEAYLWHERRKYNKGAINGRKFDIGPAQLEPSAENPRRYRKLGLSLTTIRARVTDDREGFDYPARYRLDHPEIPDALSFTPTYAGQALRGETVEICGFVEQAEDGARRMVVGSSREAPGEYVRVIAPYG